MSTQKTNNSRRDFLKISSLAGGGLLLGLSLSGCSKPGALGTEGGQPVAWLKIDGENGITVLVDRSEMGQGVYTSLTQLLAEELEVSLAAIRVVAAPVNAVYVNALLGAQITGGSTSVRDGWDKLRKAGSVPSRNCSLTAPSDSKKQIIESTD